MLPQKSYMASTSASPVGGFPSERATAPGEPTALLALRMVRLRAVAISEKWNTTSAECASTSTSSPIQGSALTTLTRQTRRAGPALPNSEGS